VLQPGVNETAAETAAGEDAAGDDTAGAAAEANGDEVDEDAGAMGGAVLDSHNKFEYELLSPVLTPTSGHSVDVQSGIEDVMYGEQNGGPCIRLSFSSDDTETVHSLSEASETAVTCSSELRDVACAVDSDRIQVVVDDAASDVDVHSADVDIEAVAEAAPDEPHDPPAEANAAVADAAEVVEPVGNIIPAPIAVLAPQGLGDVHQAMMQGGGPVGFQPYKHPNLLALRVFPVCCAGFYRHHHHHRKIICKVAAIRNENIKLKLLENGWIKVGIKVTSVSVHVKSQVENVCLDKLLQSVVL